MLDLSIGQSAIRASQTGLETVANNIANANTPGYHRQVVRLNGRSPIERLGIIQGTGVEVARLERLVNEVVEAALTENISDAAAVDEQLAIARQIETFAAPASGSLTERLQEFFNSLERLSANPSDTSQRSIVLRNADSLATEITELAERIGKISASLDIEIRQTVVEINSRFEDISDINQKVTTAQVRGRNPNDLLDRRDLVLNELAALLDVELQDQGNANVVLLASQGQVLIGDDSVQLQAVLSANGEIEVTYDGREDPITPSSGKLAGLLEARNGVIPRFLQDLETFRAELVGAVNSIHATGVGPEGSFNVLVGTNGVSDPTAALNSTELAGQITSGNLVVSVTDTSTGQRVLNTIAIDPNSDSLQDVVAAFNSVANLNAVVNTQTGTLRITSNAGFEFDFAGGVDSLPTAATFTGTSVPELSGFYTGTQNDQFQFTISGNGTVGVTAGLTADVRDASGNLVTSLSIGQEYEPGSELLVADGISISFSSGTVNSGDVFSVPAITDPDEAGILPALGLNSFFVGQSVNDIRVNPELLQNPNLLATTFSGEPADIRNLEQLLGVRDLPIPGLGNQSLPELLAGFVADVGRDVSELQQLQNQHQLIGDNLRAEQQQFSGVDPNEELLSMLQFQRSFQLASRFIATVDEAIDELIALVG